MQIMPNQYQGHVDWGGTGFDNMPQAVLLPKKEVAESSSSVAEAPQAMGEATPAVGGQDFTTPVRLHVPHDTLCKVSKRVTGDHHSI